MLMWMLCVGHHDSKELKLHLEESLHNKQAASNRQDARRIGKFLLVCGINRPGKNSFCQVEKTTLAVPGQKQFSSGGKTFFVCN